MHVCVGLSAHSKLVCDRGCQCVSAPRGSPACADCRVPGRRVACWSAVAPGQASIHGEHGLSSVPRWIFRSGIVEISRTQSQNLNGHQPAVRDVLSSSSPGALAVPILNAQPTAGRVSRESSVAVRLQLDERSGGECRAAGEPRVRGSRCGRHVSEVTGCALHVVLVIVVGTRQPAHHGRLWWPDHKVHRIEARRAHSRRWRHLPVRAQRTFATRAQTRRQLEAHRTGRRVAWRGSHRDCPSRSPHRIVSAEQHPVLVLSDDGLERMTRRRQLLRDRPRRRAPPRLMRTHPPTAFVTAVSSAHRGRRRGVVRLSRAVSTAFIRGLICIGLYIVRHSCRNEQRMSLSRHL